MADYNSPAVNRGVEMMKIPMRDLPAEAFIFAGYMCSKYGMCGEVLLTAYCYYAQIVEGLECANDDELYKAHESVRVDWAFVQREWERIVTEEKLLARWRPAKVGDVFRFQYEGKDDVFNKDLAVVEVKGTKPGDLVFFEDMTHSKQENLTLVSRIGHGGN